jgi:alpha-mannosidase
VPGPFLDGVAAAYRLNCPPRRSHGADVEPLVTVAGEGVLIEAVKSAEDGSGDVIVRLYEAIGRQTRARLTVHFPVRAVQRVDLLERPVDAGKGDPLELRLRAFQIATLRISRAEGG